LSLESWLFIKASPRAHTSRRFTKKPYHLLSQLGWLVRTSRPSPSCIRSSACFVSSELSRYPRRGPL